MKQLIFLFFLSCIVSEIHALKEADCEGLELKLFNMDYYGIK